MIISPLPSRPWYRITQRFGENPEVYSQFGHEGHNGIDFGPRIPGLRGYSVFAPHEGYAQVGYDSDGYGNYVAIVSQPYDKDGHQRYSVLAHLESVNIPDGTYIAAGDIVGRMGNTGFSSNVHLHWTYKKMKGGKVLGKENGYSGALDVGRYTLPWITRPITA